MEIKITDKGLVNKLLGERKKHILNFKRDRKMMNEGAFGRIYSYFNEEFKIKIIMKEEKGGVVEAKISKKLRKNQCDIIRSIPYEDYILMPEADGTINDLMWKNIGDASKSDTYHKKFALSIGNEILEQIKCLNRVDSKYIYTDLHLANIFYTNNDDGTIKIQLGDFGSMVDIHDSGLYTFTMCPAEYLNPNRAMGESNMCYGNTFRHADADPMEISKILSFLIGICLLYLIVEDDNGRGKYLHGGYRWGDLYNSDKYDKYIKKLDRYYLGTKKKILGNLIAKDPNDRPDLRKMTLMDYIDSKKFDLSEESEGDQEERIGKINELRERVEREMITTKISPRTKPRSPRTKPRSPRTKSRSPRTKSSSPRPKPSTRTKPISRTNTGETKMGIWYQPSPRPKPLERKPDFVPLPPDYSFSLKDWLLLRGLEDKYSAIRSEKNAGQLYAMSREELLIFFKKHGIPSGMDVELVGEILGKTGQVSKRKKRKKRKRKSRRKSRKRKSRRKTRKSTRNK